MKKKKRKKRHYHAPSAGRKKHGSLLSFQGKGRKERGVGNLRRALSDGGQRKDVSYSEGDGKRPSRSSKGKKRELYMNLG